MRDAWYSDNRDLIKWGSLLRLAKLFSATRILQLAYYRPSEFSPLLIDGQEHEIPEEVIAHFRNIRTVQSLSSEVRVTVFDPILQDRESHQQTILTLLPAFQGERCIVFLDPDTGLQPENPSLNHVLDSEAQAVWDAMKTEDLFALYQHQTNRSGQPWIEEKREQLARDLAVSVDAVGEAKSPEIAHDVVLFYCQKLRE